MIVAYVSIPEFVKLYVRRWLRLRAPFFIETDSKEMERKFRNGIDWQFVNNEPTFDWILLLTVSGPSAVQSEVGSS